jgi:enamine deaminase RidA (YjgF/YER057c/UK114 family)
MILASRICRIASRASSSARSFSMCPECPFTQCQCTSWVSIAASNPARFLYVAGTMGLDERGVAGKSLAEQLDLIWRNIRAILASADMTVNNIVRLTSYLRDPAYAEENAKARVKALNGRVIPTIGADAVERLAGGDRGDRGGVKQRPPLPKEGPLPPCGGRSGKG